MAICNLYFLNRQMGDCLESSDRNANCKMTERQVLVFLLSLGIPCGMVASHAAWRHPMRHSAIPCGLGYIYIYIFIYIICIQALIFLLSLVASAGLFGYKVSSFPRLRAIWREKRELDLKRDHDEDRELHAIGHSPSPPMRDATETAIHAARRSHGLSASVASSAHPHSRMLAAVHTESVSEKAKEQAALNKAVSLYGVC